MIDIYHSRRSEFRHCYYYLRDEDSSVGDLSMWVLQNRPYGEFFASEVNINTTSNAINNTFMFDSHSVVISTNDEVPKLQRGSIVYYNNHAWLVDNIQQSIHKKETEFDNGTHATTYISLRR